MSENGQEKRETLADIVAEYRRDYEDMKVNRLYLPTAEHLTDRTLNELDIELTDEAQRYERLYKGKPTSNYGMDCDRRDWLSFHEWVKEKIGERIAKESEK